MRSIGLAFGAAVVASALAAYAAPPPAQTVSEFADAERVISAESGTAHAGDWRTDKTPYLREIQDTCGVDHPSQFVAIRGPAQSGKSQALLNTVAHCICTAPRSIMVATPSISKAQAWNREQWEPTVDVTEALRMRVLATTSRSGEESTTYHKRFRGGFLKIITVSSVRELQSTSIGLMVYEEPTDYPADVGGRGDPCAQLSHRLDAWDEDGKTIAASTPGELLPPEAQHIAVSCRITTFYLAGDQRQYYLPCPHCGDFMLLRFEDMNVRDGRVGFNTPCCGEFVEEHHRERMLAGGDWVRTYEVTREDEAEQTRLRNANPAPGPVILAADMAKYRSGPYRDGGRHLRTSDARHPSFHFWQAYSPFRSWAAIWKQSREVRGKPTEEKAFQQQVLALPWEGQTELPESGKIVQAAAHLAAIARGLTPNPDCPGEFLVPAWAGRLVGVADVQGYGIPWSVYAYGPGGRRARIATGIVAGSPEHMAVWNELATTVANRRFAGEISVDLGLDAFGVDTGGHWHAQAHVFCKSRGVFALKGKPNDPDAIPLEARALKKPIVLNGRSYGRVTHYLVGTHNLKKAVHAGLHQMIGSAEAGAILPETLLLPPGVADADVGEFLAERLVQPKSAAASARAQWVRTGKNEELDKAVYAHSLASYKGWLSMSEALWAAEIAARARPGEDSQALPFDALWSPNAPAPAVVVKPQPAKLAENPKRGAAPGKSRLAAFANLHKEDGRG